MSQQLDFVITRENIHENSHIRWNSSSISPAARNVVTSGLDVCDIYFRYKTTSYNTKLRTVELLDLENMRIVVGILLLCFSVSSSAHRV